MATLRLTLDVETIPTQNQAFIKAINLKHPGSMTNEKTIEKWVTDKRPGLMEEAYRKTALDSTKGELVVIGWAINDEPTTSVYRKLGESEADLLTAFYTALKPRIDGGYYGHILWIGHNILGFDLPFLWHRSIINKVSPCMKIPYNVKPWSDQIFDTRLTWKSASSATSNLEAICKAVGIPVKQDMHGSEVWDYIKCGEVEKVARYCESDVEATRELYYALQPIGGVNVATG